MRLHLFRKLIVLGAALVLSGCGGVSGLDFSSMGRMGSYDTPSHYGSYLAARQAQMERDTESAAELYQRVLQTGPVSADLIERAYVLEVSNGNLNSAARLAEVAVALDPENAFARLTVSIDHFEEGRYADAGVALDGIDTGPLTLLTVALIRSWALMGEGRADEAMDFLANVENIPGIELFKVYHGALMADLAGNDQEAEVAYVAAITASGGGSVRAVQAYGNFLERQGRSQEASVIYGAYLQIAPNNPQILAAKARADQGRRAQRLVPNAKAGASEAMFSVASVLAAERSFEVPSLYLQFALHLRPNHDSARMLLAEIYEVMDLEERAVLEFANISRNSALKHEAEVQRALILNRMDRQDEAIAILMGLTDDDPRALDAWVGLADTLRSEERYEEAADAYAHAIGLVEEEFSGFWALYYAYGISLERIGEWEEAEASFLHALELHEDHPYVLNYLGYSWIEQGMHLEQALEMIHRAVEQRPDDGFIVDSLGWGYYQLGQYDEAVIYLEQAAELTAGDPTINDHLGDAYWRKGMERQARFQWGHALLLEMDDETRATVENKLVNGLGDQPETAMEDGGQGNGGE